MNQKHRHFKGKTPLGHLKEARLKGKSVATETHGLEPPGNIVALLDSAKNLSGPLLISWVLLRAFEFPLMKAFLFIALLSFGLILFFLGRSSYLGWARLERLHRLIEEEQWEIEHHRDQEREELMEMYRAKGFSNDLLHQVVETLMSDENRLLEVMLTEELGLPLEAYEHPLKQGLFAALGGIVSSAIFILGILALPSYGPLIASILIVSFSSLWYANMQKNELIRALVWNLAILMLSSGSVYFLSKILIRGFL